MPTTQESGFVAGTLVHTSRGLTPIQDIKAGDKVLSKPEHGQSEPTFKRVLNTFKSAKKEKLYKVEYHSHTASDRGENSLNYIFCTDNPPFWRSLEPNDAKGEWTAASGLFGGYLNSAHGDALELSDFSFMPVRTLPNFPQGCAYVQSLEHMTDDWNTPENVEFVQFKQNGYQFVCLADNAEESRRIFKETLTAKSSDSIWHLSSASPFLVEPELYKKLNTRFLQDRYIEMHTPDSYIEDMNQPILDDDGSVICEDSIGDQAGYEKVVYNLRTYGDNTGLTDTSLHNSVDHYYGEDYPNPYSDYVYNLEVADYHTYYISHDGVWVKGQTT